MSLPDDLLDLPAFVGLDLLAVLAGHRRGTSIQIDDTYFTGQLRARDAIGGEAPARRRVKRLRASRSAFEAIDVELDTLTEPTLLDASAAFRRELLRVPEIEFLERYSPGHCVAVPEWLRTGRRVHYGARIYLLREGDDTEPDNVLQKNVDAVVNDSFAIFEEFQGRLHGYPRCCVEFYQKRSPSAPAPERLAIKPVRHLVDEGPVGSGPVGSIDDIVPTPFGSDAGYAFFAREFFPGPGCETARALGREIYESLTSNLPATLVDDYFRLNLGYNYLVARAVDSGRNRRPPPGALGREHLAFHLPLRKLLELPKYE